MRKTIWKFPLEAAVGGLSSVQHTAMPKGAVPLSAGYEHDQFWVWAEVDPSAEKTLRTFITAPTGQELGDWELGPCLGRVDIPMANRSGLWPATLRFHVYEALSWKASR